MMTALNKKNNLLLFYQCSLAVATVFTFFTDAPLYLFTAGIGPQPVIFIYLFSLASTPLIILLIRKKVNISLLVPAWCTGYITVSLISFFSFLTAEIAYKELQSRILASIFLMTTLLIFSGEYIVQLWARRALLIAGFIAVFNNVYELLNPLAFSGLNITDRPAGFYIDPNRTGCALMLSMIFAIDLVPPKYRLYFAGLIGFGILLTFSRGAILTWLIVLLFYLKKRLVPQKQLLYWMIAIATIVIILLVGGESLINLDTIPYGIRERLEWFQEPSLSEDSADSRVDLAKAGWELFAESPFVGNGIGSTLEWNLEKSTHNMYLYFMADHGILGTLILPLLVYAVSWPLRGASKYIGFSFTVLMLIWSLFSHTVLEDRFSIMSFSLMSAMTTTSQLEQKLQMEYK